MNESWRTRKLVDGRNINNYKINWWYNFVLGMMISGPALVFINNFQSRMGTGVPYFHRPKYYFVGAK